MSQTGTVKSVLLDRGFGFISRSGGADLFFHVKSVDPSLPFNEQLLERRVKFEIVQTAKGERAESVRGAD